MNWIEKVLIEKWLRGEVKSMSRYKSATHIIAVIVTFLAGFFVTPAGRALLAQYPKISTAVMLLTFLAGLYHNPKTNAPASGSGSLRAAFIFFALFFFAGAARAQNAAPDPANIYAAGASFNNGATPEVAGTALYAHLVDASAGTYAFSVVDALPSTVKPFTVTTNMGVGIAQKVFTIGSVPIFIPSSAGISWSGSNTGWAWSTGGLADIRLGSKSNWRMFLSIRVVKSNVSNSGVQLIPGIMFAWGK